MSPDPSLVCLSMKLVRLTRETKPWTTGELAILRTHAHLGAACVADLLGRSVSSVKNAAYRNRISLRPRGCRRGLILGQPRGVSLRREVRESLVRDRRDELLERRAKVDADAALCPCCAKRPARHSRTGYCTPCAIEHQTAAYEELTASDAAMQKAWAARQRRKAVLDGMDAT